MIRRGRHLSHSRRNARRRVRRRASLVVVRGLFSLTGLFGGWWWVAAEKRNRKRRREIESEMKAAFSGLPIALKTTEKKTSAPAEPRPLGRSARSVPIRPNESRCPNGRGSAALGARVRDSKTPLQFRFPRGPLRAASPCLRHLPSASLRRISPRGQCDSYPQTRANYALHPR